jgi:hypothetical protein
MDGLGGPGWARWAYPRVFFFLFFIEAGILTVLVKIDLHDLLAETVLMPVSVNLKRPPRLSFV